METARIPLGPPQLGRSPQPTETLRSAEFWLKVAVHIAGLAALLATPTVAALMSNLGDQIGLLP